MADRQIVRMNRCQCGGTGLDGCRVEEPVAVLGVEEVSASLAFDGDHPLGVAGALHSELLRRQLDRMTPPVSRPEPEPPAALAARVAVSPFEAMLTQEVPDGQQPA